MSLLSQPCDLRYGFAGCEEAATPLGNILKEVTNHQFNFTREFAEVVQLFQC